jgi:hypothetical protein
MPPAWVRECARQPARIDATGGRRRRRDEPTDDQQAAQVGADSDRCRHSAGNGSDVSGRHRNAIALEGRSLSEHGARGPTGDPMKSVDT